MSDVVIISGLPQEKRQKREISWDANRAAVCYLHPPRQGLRYGLCRRVIKSLQTLFAIFKLSWRCENFQKELSFSCLQKGRQRGKKDRQDDFKHCHK
jgi:hypothetical protein